MSARTYRVLIVDRDVDALASLAAILRERGMRVSLANSIGMASERAKSAAFDAILAAADLVRVADGEQSVVDTLAVELREVPPVLTLIDQGPSAADDVLRNEPEKIIERIAAVAKEVPIEARVSAVPTAFTLPVTPLRPLLFVLAKEKRSGTLAVSTKKGAGEVTVLNGDVIDAIYMHFEGTKALARLLLETDGRATFSPSNPTVMRRIEIPADSLLSELDRQQALAKSLQGELAVNLSTQFFVTGEGAPVEASRAMLAVHDRLRQPTTLGELLDELPQLDAEILSALMSLVAKGLVATHQKSTDTQLATEDEMQMLRGVAARAKKSGFSGAARIVFAGAPGALSQFALAALRLDQVDLPLDSIPSVPVPHTMLTVHLGEGVALDLVALPLVAAYAPLWPMALAGVHLVVKLEETSVLALGAACDAHEVAVTTARALVSESTPVTTKVAAELIKAALLRSA